MIVGLAMPAAPKPMIRPILVTIAAVAPKLTMVGLNPIIGSAPWASKLRVSTYPGLATGAPQPNMDQALNVVVSHCVHPSTSRADIRVRQRKTCVLGANISDQTDL